MYAKSECFENKLTILTRSVTSFNLLDFPVSIELENLVFTVVATSGSNNVFRDSSFNFAKISSAAAEFFFFISAAIAFAVFFLGG